jgi:hypothetical protein
MQKPCLLDPNLRTLPFEAPLQKIGRPLQQIRAQYLLSLR